MSLTGRGLLVLCDPHDAAALWAAEGLGRRGMAPVEVVTAAMLGRARRWEHRIRGGVVDVEITLEDGRRISSCQPQPVLNRLRVVPTKQLAAAAPADHDYAVAEFHALFSSWLAGYPGRMVNRPSPLYLGGQWHPPSGWSVHAARAGLCTAPYVQGSEHPLELSRLVAGYGYLPSLAGRSVTVFVVAGTPVPGPPVPAPVLDACGRLADRVGDDLLGIELLPRPSGEWEFVAAGAVPDLRLGGEPLLDALAAALADSS